MTSIFVYEFLSGGGVVDDADPQDAAELLAQGLAMRDALAADLLAAHCRLCVACGAGVAPVAGAESVSARPGESPGDFVARVASRHDAVWAVAPETGDCLGTIERAVRGRARWLGCDAAAIALASSKAATTERLHARGVATPRAMALDRGVLTPRAVAAPSPSRWVVKPDDGAGAVATRVHADRASAVRDLDSRDGVACLEPWVDGDAMSLALLARRDGAELLAVNRQRIALAADGSVHFEGVEIDVMPVADARRPRLAALAQQVHAAVPGLRGFVGIDFVWHATLGPVVIEVNPRLTSAYVGLSRRLQRNVAAEALGTSHG
jgi:predicted ATP-grasp superfamily ATP-dependent carboligase